MLQPEIKDKRCQDRCLLAKRSMCGLEIMMFLKRSRRQKLLQATGFETTGGGRWSADIRVSEAEESQYSWRKGGGGSKEATR